ncbi:MAG: DUF4358 domain-containing protein [Coprococcus sp.]|nr:DUF4358 domain-containing protein [Coprococcus sp.]
MKDKISAIVIMLSLLISVTGCGKKENKDVTAASCYELALAMAYTDENRDNLVVCNANNEEYEAMLNLMYGLTVPDDGCILYSMNEEPTEYAVLRARKYNDYINTREIEDAFKKYIEERIAAYTGYYPEGVDILQNSRIFIVGEYVVLDISQNPDAAKAAFDELYSMEDSAVKAQMDTYTDMELKLEENRKKVLYSEDSFVNSNIADNTSEQEKDTEDEDNQSEQVGNITSEDQLHDVDDSAYYNKDIVTAYLEKKPELLADDKDIAVLNRVTEIIDECITEDMTDIEKEKAIHDYMCEHMDYDRQGLGAAMTHMEDSDNPYGMLVNGYGICTGYASTFKLFMDCLGIECMVVEGMVYAYTDDHAWNKVKLGVTWYNVDVTWDDPVSDAMSEDDTTRSKWISDYTFFNCSDAVLEENDHLWNRTEYPESLESMNEQ